MAHADRPYENARRENFFKASKYEEVYLWEYANYRDVVTRLPYLREEVYNLR